MKKTELSIGGMSCGHRVARVKNAISNVKGVLKADVSLKAKNTIVEYDSDAASLEMMKKAVAEMNLGYEVVEYKEL
ncbi:MAG: heavy-metal-associated domain-containing protein [Candidatus Hydrothermarchaeota archaeon]|jgi:copper chaperone|nr:heavy-metal-associated domain-containing protein [Candidatus Hydrothermarchaeota archaeon]